MVILGRIQLNLLKNRGYYYNMINLCRAKSTVNDNDNVSLKRPVVLEQDINSDTVDDVLSEPTTCCMSGCPNCVWIEYAEKLSKQFNESSGEVQNIILDKVTDPNMKAFLLMELKCRNLIK